MALCVAGVSTDVCTGFTTQDHLPTPPSPFSLLCLLPEASIGCCYLLPSTAEATPFFSEVGHAFACLLQAEVELSLLSERLSPSSPLTCRRHFLPWPSVDHLSFPCFPSLLIQISAPAWIKSPYSVFTTHRSASSLELTTVSVL